MKYLVIVVCLFFYVQCFGQKKPAKHLIKPAKAINTKGFLGIGILKIGSDSSILIEYAKANLNRIADPLGFESLQWRIDEDKKGAFKELLRLKDSEIKRSYCPDVTEYYLSQYEISGITIKNIYLKYYLGKLIQFKSDDNSEIEDALTVKYGKSNLEVDKKKYSCMHNLTGIETPLEAKTFMSTWENGPITAMSVLAERYDEHCNKSVDTYFMFFLEDKKIEDCENAGLKNVTPVNQRDKNSLKDF